MCVAHIHAQGVILLSRSADDLDFTGADVELLQYVAAHVGGVFFEKNESVNIAMGIGNVIDSSTCHTKFGVMMNSLRAIPGHPKQPTEVYVKMEIWHGVNVIAETWTSKNVATKKNLKNNVGGGRASEEKRHSLESSSLKINFSEADAGANSTADFEQDQGGFNIAIRDLPEASRLFVTVHDAKNDRIIGHTILPLFAQDKTLKGVRTESIMCVHESYAKHIREAKSVGPAGNMVIDFEIGRVDLLGAKSQKSFKARGSLFGGPKEDVRYKQIANANGQIDTKLSRRMSQLSSPKNKKSTNTSKRASMSDYEQTVKKGKFLPDEVKQVILKDLLHDLTDEEKKLIWMSRRELVSYPNALPKLLMAIDYGNRDEVLEAENYMEDWALSTNPLDALQLLDIRYASPKVRAYAVKQLNMMCDEELSEVMLQLVQVLKFEPHYDTALCRFLLRRSLLNPFVCGHTLFWMLQSERHIADTRHHCRVLLELYLRNCGSHRTSLGHQMFIINRLEEVAQIIKNCPENTDRAKVLREELSKIVFPKSFQLPLDPYKTCKGLQIDKCRVMSSKKLPLWLTFVREDPWEPPFVVLFKSGDDLRQDQLTLQVLRVMDRLWKEDGLDLKMNPYRCCATGFEQGMLEVVLDSATLAGITMNNVTGTGLSKKVNATRETMKGRNSLGLWLEKHNRGKNEDEGKVMGLGGLLKNADAALGLGEAKKAEFPVHGDEASSMHHQEGKEGRR